ncbi:hypothetical protein GCM10011376_34940 [Nocardioides flavus (ex Wang et al. 2016)]|uniref:Mce-associated membrane protein n=1 Tax=Nocardioides flavus (ex Wang et al. 2016) TaxID=2058780 RepID=A0ABQ3HRU9_9ACTN|nr:hypothetical protein [Nocardioides flavus (ex Wang et al. 2016)]GHE18884.1 hypothetical protein GCM10011376_34940 [Nocardioides flavus (ex Wang et al. 2016)]
MASRRWVAGLAVLVCAAALALVWVVRDGAPVPAGDVSSADSASASVVSAAVKTAVRERAAEGATAAYGFSWRTLADDKAAARALMTPAMQARYDRTMAGVATTSRRDRTVVTAEVVDTALVTASSDHARVLVFVNQRTSGDDLAAPRLDLDRVLVSLERMDGEWRVSELDAL